MSQGKVDFQSRTHVSRETLERLEVYASLVERWTKRINLISPNTLSDLWTRHFLDSAQLLKAAPKSARSWVDLGSGAGFPGAVVAILTADAPGPKVTLVESDQRKAAFLRAVSRETGVGFSVICRRIEDIDPLRADIVSARALAPLDKLLGYAERHLAPGGRALFPKGQKAGQEVAEALEHWRFDCESHPSETDPEAVILSIGDIERV